MMNKYERRLLWCAFVAYLSAPAVVQATPWTYADEPLWLGTAVKHNLMFAIDDSGSMDWETSFDIKDGTPYINSNGDFVDSSGSLSTGGAQYAYVFPNGYARPYNGKRLYTDRYAIPPIAQYAAARTAEYNRAYYDPAVDYLPWPTFTQYTDDTFEDASLTATKCEPVGVFGSDTINLFSNLDTSTKGDYWEFDIRDNNMVCEEDGRTCGVTGRKEYTYYPATYYLKDDSGAYYYHAGVDGFTSSTTEIVEAETGTVSGFIQGSAALLLATAGTEQDKISAARDSSSSSGGDFVGTIEAVGASFGSAPSNGNVTYTVTIPDSGLTSIWVRNLGVDSTTNSLWAKLSDGSGDYVGTLPNGDAWDGDNFGELRYNTSEDGTWQWTKWSDVNLTAGTYTFELAYREGGTLVDQIMFTTSTATPVGIEEYDTLAITEKSCATSTAADYLDFTRNPERYRASDSYVVDDSLIDNGRSLAFDGSCLMEYRIAGSDTDTYDNGTSVVRTVLQEKQNFANWFQFHRKRHMAMRGALASSVQSIDGISTGMFWINRRQDIDAADMNDMDVDADVEAFVRAHYQGVPLYHQTDSAGTSLRSSLDHARKIFADTAGPITSECQKNYTLLFTDGFNTQTSYTGGTTTDADGNEVPNIGNEDGSAGTPYADTHSGTLADIAHKAYDGNIRPDLPTGSVRVDEACNDGTADPWLDCNTDPHMNTYTVGLGVAGDLFGPVYNSVEDVYTTAPTWPNVSSQGLPQIDDLFHAAVNGRGEMYSANSSDELATALDSALDDIVATIGSGSGVTFNSSSLQANDGTSIYTTLFNSADWSGNVTARALDGQTGAVQGAVWKDSTGVDAGAQELLDERDLNANDRVIITKGATDGVAFQWDKLTTDQKADLKTGAAVGTFVSGSDEAAQARLAWVRGDMNIAGLRDRGSRLGDIIHSSPVYVGTPASPWPDADPFGFEGSNPNYLDRNRYSDFKNRDKNDGGAADRAPVLYVGANDGMLHGFDARNDATNGGEELMAYIPNLVYSDQSGEGLHYLADPNYSHKYYVDQSPIVQDVYTKGDDSDSSADWRTVLIGGLRGGGKGLFALDVTHPDEFSELDANADKLAMWEFDGTNASAAAANLGYQLSPPAIAMMNNEKWAVIFGNGAGSVNGRAVLFVVYIEEGLDGTWTVDDDYMMIDTGKGSTLDPNGLSGVAVADTNGDFMADRIYAGDIQGNMWAFDVSSDTPIVPAKGATPEIRNWAVADASGDPLFTAQYSYTDPDTGSVVSERQPITAAPGLAFNTEEVTSNNLPNILVTFGTGQYLEKNDISNASVQSYYTVWDKSDHALTRSSLTQRSLSQSGTKLSLSGGVADPWDSVNGVYGWFFDMAPEVIPDNQTSGTVQENGERLINKPLLAPDKDLGPVAIFASMIPDSSECSGGGSSVLYALPLLTGTNPDKAIADLNGDGLINDDDKGVGVSKDDLINDPNRLGQYLYGSKGDSSGVDVTETTINSAGDREGRLGWFELIDE